LDDSNIHYDLDKKLDDSDLLMCDLPRESDDLNDQPDIWKDINNY